MSDEPLRPAGSPGFWTVARVGAALDGGGAGRRSTRQRADGRGGGVAAVAAGDATRPLSAVATDSRTVGPGDLFVALTGDRHDGHRFLPGAVERGAAAVVVSDARAAIGLEVPAFVVPDTLVALGALARYRRRAWGGPVVAVAGSNGKTTTKEMLRAALGARLVVHATSANYNNRVGVPLTLLSVPDGADIAVVEVGTNAPGEVALLRDITDPDVAVVTSIGEEHLAGFGDLAGVLAEESEILVGVGIAVVPASEPPLVDAARARAAHVLDVGLGEGVLRAERWHLDADGQVALEIEGLSLTVPIRGLHNARNALLALAVARACGISLADAAAGLAVATPPPMRSAWLQVGRATVINDAYNANPASARAALEMLDAVGAGRQRVVVLGTMRELGASASRLHGEIARRALGSPFDIVAGVGDFAPALEEAGGGDPRVVTAPDVDDLWPKLRGRLAPDAVVLLKASRGVQLERLVPPLTDWAAT